MLLINFLYAISSSVAIFKNGVVSYTNLKTSHPAKWAVYNTYKYLLHQQGCFMKNKMGSRLITDDFQKGKYYSSSSNSSSNSSKLKLWAIIEWKLDSWKWVPRVNPLRNMYCDSEFPQTALETQYFRNGRLNKRKVYPVDSTRIVFSNKQF